MEALAVTLRCKGCGQVLALQTGNRFRTFGAEWYLDERARLVFVCPVPDCRTLNRLSRADVLPQRAAS